jgi:Bacterial PH domain
MPRASIRRGVVSTLLGYGRRGQPAAYTCASEAKGAGVLHAAAEGAAAPAAPVVTSVATLLTRHVLRDGELVILILKPSRWYIALSSLSVIAAVAIILGALHNAPHLRGYVEAGVIVIAGRIMWSVLNWMGRLYVLTDQRVLRLSGVFSIEIFDCPLRKISGTRVFRAFRERLLGLGSIEITPSIEDRPCGIWQTVRRPHEVNEQIQQAVRRSSHL